MGDRLNTVYIRTQLNAASTAGYFDQKLTVSF